MTWWSILYLLFLVGVGVMSVRGSMTRHPWGATALEFVTSVAWPLLVCAYFAPAVAARIGRLAIPAYVVAFAWTAYTLWRDARPSALISEGDNLSPQAARVAYAVLLLLDAATVIPVVILGAIVAGHQW